MDDLEICKRIAEIEGVKVDEISNNFLIRKDITFGLRVNVSMEFKRCKTIEDYMIVENERKDCLYNPLTDDALCFQLMVKYDVNISRYYDSASISSDYTDKPDVSNVSFSTDDKDFMRKYKQKSS